MTSTSSKPDLRHIGQDAFMEVLSVLLSLPATPRESSIDISHSDASDQITGTVQLAGHRISGNVQLRLPLPFAARAVQRLTGLDGNPGEANELAEDTAGEIANMVAGRVAAQLTAIGYPCTLSTPLVFRGVGSPLELEHGVDHAQAELLCDGHRLSIELECRYATA
jgi:CheY-specific phosphatase CheX